jgi:hypothetical protein
MPSRLHRRFKYPWGEGEITEEAAYSGQHHESAIQLLEYDDEHHEGGWSIRFAFYNLQGRFQRTPLLIGEDEIEGLRAALKKTPQLRKLLQRLVKA